MGRKVTYGELSAKFGDPVNGWEPILAVIACRLHKRGCPMLPVLVVDADTGLPNEAAYHQFGLVGVAAMRREQERCYDFNWPGFFFVRVSKPADFGPQDSG
ncbi:hypothetical protein B5V01_11070 [Mesorhizobium erdmanii]|uniref:Uncharacterized protein n=2 Tax=Mesorhizobium TaxID=68287 RepID=A0A3M9XDI6_9HYPH|nr:MULTISPECIES: hypothetical protein [Mesorhizobium]RNJ45826.1 hypothetical protein DNR46_10210 [Mesorhizobium japonicum]RXT47133.1 hypothetical protein B5V01_11070 [Mesorhizobium erdmanii]